MKCVRCSKEAEYVLDGSSFCTEHFKEAEGKKPKTDSLIAEYEVLNEYVHKREDGTLLANSIIISATLFVVTFAIQNRNNLGMSFFFNVPIAGFIPIISTVLIFVLYFLWGTSSAVDNVCFGRIHEIENILHIEGTGYVLKNVENKWWYGPRRNLWHIVFILFIGVYLFTAIWLFRQPLL